MSLFCAGVAFAADQFLSDSKIVPIVLPILELSLVGLVYVVLVLTRPKLFIGPYASALVRNFAHLMPSKLRTVVLRLLSLQTDDNQVT